MQVQKRNKVFLSDEWKILFPIFSKNVKKLGNYISTIKYV